MRQKPKKKQSTRKPRFQLKGKAPGMRSHAARVQTSSKDSKHHTPEEFLGVVRQFGKIGLDPSADTHKRHQFAKVNYDGRKGSSGLKLKWRGHGLVYSNPPYGHSLHKWIRKAAKEFKNASGKDECIMLVPARPDVRWFQDVVLKKAAAWCFIKGRLRFGRTPKDPKKRPPAPFPSLVIYFGARPEKFKAVFIELGWVIVRSSKEKNK